MKEVNDYDLPKIRLGMPSSTGTWLHGCQQPQHRYVELEVRTHDHKHILRLGMTLDQFTHMLTSTQETTCTLFRYCDEGPLKTHEVPKPKSVSARMRERMGEVHTMTKTRLEDLFKDVHEMVNGKKPGKKDLERLLHEVRILRDNYGANEGFAVKQAQEEVDAMFDNARTQLAQILPQGLPETEALEIVHHMIPSKGSEPALLEAPESDAAPVVVPHTPKDRVEKPIEQMTSMELGEELTKELRRLERLQPKTDGHASLYHAHAWATMPHRVRIQYVSYQSDSLLDMDEARAYLGFLRSLEGFDGYRHHFHYIQALRAKGEL